jgi:hypothetical protein
MNFNSPIQRDGIIGGTELSGLASARESGGLRQQWKAQNQHAQAIQSLTNKVSQLQRQISRMSAKGATSGMHPFKIYQIPECQRNFINGDDCYRFKVRDGSIDVNVVFGVGGMGTDWMQSVGTNPIMRDPSEEAYLFPYTNQVPPNDSTLVSNVNTWNEASIPNDGNLYYFWLSFQPGYFGFTVCYGYNFNTSTYQMTAIALEAGLPTTFQDTWFTFPYNDPYHIVIGAVSIVKSVPVIRQILRTDINFNDLNNSTSIDGFVNFSKYDGAIPYFSGRTAFQDTTVSGTTLRTAAVWDADTPDSGTSPYARGNTPGDGYSMGVDLTNNDITNPGVGPWRILSQTYLQAYLQTIPSVPTTKTFLGYP